MLRKKYKNGRAGACSRRLLVTPNPLINNGFPVGNAILGVPRKQQKNFGNTVGANCVVARNNTTNLLNTDDWWTMFFGSV